MGDVKIDGVKLVLRGREFVMPPLTAAALEDFEAECNLLAAMPFRLERALAEGHPGLGPTKEELKAVVKLAHVALKPNYPELQPAELREHIDAVNVWAVLPALQGQDVAAIQRRRAAEAEKAKAAAGEAGSP